MFDKLTQEVFFFGQDGIFNELALISKEGGKNNEPTTYQCHIGELKKEDLMLLNNEGEEPNVVPLQLSIALVIINALVGTSTIPTRPMSIHEAQSFYAKLWNSLLSLVFMKKQANHVQCST